MMKYKQKQEQAKILYLNTDLNQKQIAGQIGVTENTISAWIDKFGWKDYKAALTITKESIVKNTYAQIAAIQQKISNENRVSTVSETDQLVKLGKLISDLDKKIDASVIIQVFMDWGKWLQRIAYNEKELDIEFIKKLTRYQDLYVTNVLNDRN